jgi:hypothetical protein
MDISRWFTSKHLRQALGALLFWVASCNAIYAQVTPGVQNTKKSDGNQNNFSYRIQTTYGTSTSAQVTGNMTADVEAILKLKAGTKITNKMGDDSGNASAVFIATPNGGNVDLKGITGENMFLIDDGTAFRSSLKTIDNLNPNITSTGSASATATHSTSVIVEKGSTTFENYYQQTF